MRGGFLLHFLELVVVVFASEMGVEMKGRERI
jgi:hypothetical protein